MKLLLLLSIAILLGTPDGFKNEDVRDDIPVNDEASTGLDNGLENWILDMMPHSDESWTVQELPIHNSGELLITILKTAVHTVNTTTQLCILGVTN